MPAEKIAVVDLLDFDRARILYCQLLIAATAPATSGIVKFLLPPRQSRGVSLGS
jgi:hypothetical protein